MFETDFYGLILSIYIIFIWNIFKDFKKKSRDISLDIDNSVRHILERINLARNKYISKSLQKVAGDIAEDIFGGPWCFIGIGMLVHGCVWGGGGGGNTVYIEVQLQMS